jgi:two-component system phosphate regulon sensor histidine kinase PhoR
VPDTDELAALAESLNLLASQLEERGHAIGRKGHEQEAVLASMAEGVLAVDSEERVISLNRAAAALVGGRQTDMRGRNLQEVVRNADLRRFASRALESSEPIEDDLVLLGDREKILHVRGTALRDSDGRSVGAVIVLGDVTEFRLLERLRRDFVANVSHELKTPIASIKGFVETLLDGALDNREDAVRFLKIVAGQADRLNSIIEDLLSLSKIERSEEAADLKLEPTDVKQVLEAAINDCQTKASERRIHVRLTCDDRLQATANSPLLEQAVVNLLDNAIKYSEPGSAVRIVSERSASEVTIAVVDHGCGIEAEHLPRLFERFYRVDRARSRKLGGTGLGLAIVKHIVAAHHGRITVESDFGAGSTFTIHLPAVAC